MDINFILERYRPGGGNRYTCPFCGRKKCFARYIDVQTGEYVDETCGKCDHENSCPVVHYPPREFFKDHPECGRRQNTWEPHMVNGRTSVLSNSRKHAPYLPVPLAQTEFFDIRWATGGCSNLQSSKLIPLMDRHLVIYPDSGEYQKWCERMKDSGHKQYTVVKMLEDYEPNTDIADVILGIARLCSLNGHG